MKPDKDDDTDELTKEEEERNRKIAKEFMEEQDRKGGK